jgi:SAM-dependent methyltransferase
MPRSFDSPVSPVPLPSAWVVRHTPLVPPGTPVLDLACGAGRHARYFAGRGHPVIAVDIDLAGVADLAGEPGVTLLGRDLESGEWPFHGAQFGGIVITNYLHRPHFPLLPPALLPGGALIVETFGAGNERFGRPRNPAFLLAPGELLAAFAESLEVVAYEHVTEETPRPAVRQRIAAVKAP